MSAPNLLTVGQVAHAMLEADKRIGEASPVERVLAAYMVLESGISSLDAEDRLEFEKGRDELNRLRPKGKRES